MAALELEWIPETLYNTAISAVVDNYSRSRRDIRSLPENIQFDVYYKEGEEWTRRSPVRILLRPEITFLNNHQKC
uniref:Amyloid beta precursor protein (cytoplasmic tail) binding protein 2 n=1 Tax=Hucho hucho TaxID=62062 RepID=A0A4W5K4L3_9TELE